MPDVLITDPKFTRSKHLSLKTEESQVFQIQTRSSDGVTGSSVNRIIIVVIISRRVRQNQSVINPSTLMTDETTSMFRQHCRRSAATQRATGSITPPNPAFRNEHHC